MSLSNSYQSYPDVQAAFDKALESPRGVRLTFPTPGKAINFRQRCYKFRLLDRGENSKIYPPGHSHHMTSQYDGLVFTLAANTVTIYPGGIDTLEMEVL